GVPLVAHTAGVEVIWKAGAPLRLERWPLRRDEARLAVRRVIAAGGEEAGLGVRVAGGNRPLRRGQCVESIVGKNGEPANIERAPPAVFEGRQPCVLAKDVGRRPVCKGLPEAETRRDLADDPPVRPRFPGKRRESTLARNAPLGVRDGAVLFTPGGGRKQ